MVVGSPHFSPASPPPWLLQSAEADLLRMSNRVRFILAVVSGELRLSNRRKADIERDLEDEGYDRLAKQQKRGGGAQVGGRDGGGNGELQWGGLQRGAQAPEAGQPWAGGVGWGGGRLHAMVGGGCPGQVVPSRTAKLSTGKTAATWHGSFASHASPWRLPSCCLPPL